MTNFIDIIKSADLDGLKKLLKKEPRSIIEMKENGISIPYIAARTGNLDIMQYIVEYSLASFNDTDPQGRTCLHYAVESGNLDVVKYLVERVGLSPLQGDKDLITPYEIAEKLKNKEISAYFEDKTGCKFDEMYQNPVHRGMFPDPSIVRVGNDYYMVNSTFVFFPCIPISHSTDLIHWKIIGHAITNPEWAYLDELEGGRGYWAPDISYYNGRFYITATYRMNDTGDVCRKQMVVSSDRPEGPYCKPAFIEEDGIDPSIFTDDDGKRYMLLNRGARIFEISKDGTQKLSEPRLLYYGNNKYAPEGPHLLKRNGWYYLFFAEGGTGKGHMITVARSRSLFGNYEPCPYNPIMHQYNPNGAIQCCGHGKPVMTQNGDWYMVYLCNRYIDNKYDMLGRETAIDSITWTPDEWPIVNSLKGPSVLQKKPNLPNVYEDICYLDNFDEDKLSNEWFFPRTPEKDGISIDNSYICIKGSKKDLNSRYVKNVVLQRQKHFSFDVEACMVFPNLENEQNAGLTCYYDENTYLKYGIYKNDNEYTLKIFEKIGNEEKFTYSVAIRPSKVLYLKIRTRNLSRIFMYSYDNENWIDVGTLENVYYICSEGLEKGKRFTGATVGMYAYSGEYEKQLYAKFDYFNYIPMD